jgi:integration host factor subunit alpha
MTLTKDHIVGSLQRRLDMSKSKSTSLFESVMETVKSALVSGDDVLISGFGKFIVRQKAARRGRNPATGEDLTLEPRRAVAFKCSAVLKEKVNLGYT